MSDIYDPRKFPFESVQLGTPFNRSGTHFIKMTINDSPIYIQPPKCVVKQGFVKSGKRVFCDLVFHTEDTHFLTWLENIEEISKNQIFENRAKWFETDLDKHDIENSLVPAYKMYKAGKMYIIRANIPTTLGKINLKVYDENEQEFSPDDLKENAEVLTVIELKGIKCSVRSFQFDLDVRQMMVVAPVKLFENCIIRKNTGADSLSMPSQIEAGVYSESEPESEKTPKKGHEDLEETYREMAEVVSMPPQKRELEMDGIYEVYMDLDTVVDAEPVQLKRRNDVYYKMYKEAKRKAIEAKMTALTNYLEARRIKTTYSLEDSSDEEDETVNEDELDKEFVENIPNYLS